MLSLVLLAAILFLGVMAQGGRASCDMWNRCTWLIFWCGAAVTVGMWAVNPWAALTFGMLVLGALTVAPWEQAFPRALYPAYAAGMAWVVLAPAMTPEMVPPVLLGFVLVGGWVGGWTLYSHWQGLRPYQRVWGRLWGWLPAPLFCWHEDSPTHLKAGQGNSNHLQSIAALTVAAGLALAWLASPWWLLGLPLLVLPLLVRVNKEGVFAQAHVHLGSACVAFLVVCLSRFHWPPWPILAGYVRAGGPEGQALFIVAVALCSIASANFPWTWFHEIPQGPTCRHCGNPALPPGVAAPETHCRCAEPRQLGPSQPLYVGSPGLLAMSLILAILVEAV